MERNKAAGTVQKFMRGYQVRERVSIVLNKSRMLRSLEEQEVMFSSFRAHLKESLQIRLAYLFRRRKAIRIKQEMLE